MARIRTIKPEFFLHEELFDLEAETGFPIRVAFAGLWCQADRDGRFKWRPRQLKTQILPYDDVNFINLLDSLAAANIVFRYEVDGEQYGCIPTWKDHQAINHREAESKIPAPDDTGRARAIPGKPGKAVVGKLRREIFERDGAICALCDSTEDLTIDHILPVSAGGKNNPENLRILCRSCNSARPVAGKALENDIARAVPGAPGQAPGEGKGKEGKGKEGKGTNTIRGLPPRDVVPVKAIVDLYHDKLPELPQCRKITPARESAIRQRVKQGDLPDLDVWAEFFDYVRESDFLMGRAPPSPGRRPFMADLEWLTKQGNYAKILEGKYHNGGIQQAGGIEEIRVSNGTDGPGITIDHCSQGYDRA